jgi:hypothetical protein
MISKANILEHVKCARRVINMQQWIEKHQYSVMCIVEEI